MKTIVAMIGWLVLLLLGNLEARAAYRAPVAVDSSFGINGLAVVPGYDATYFVDEVLGFAKATDRYLVFSIQHNISGSRLVGTMFDSSGRLVLSVGSLGSSIYAVPFPINSTARIAANGDSVYFAAVQFNSVSGDFQYYVLTVDAITGALTSFVTTGPFNNPSGGANQARAIDAIATPHVNDGVIVAGRGATALAPGTVVDLLRIDGNPATIDASNSYNFQPTAGFRINQISTALPGKVEMVGVDNAIATYSGFITSTGSTAGFATIPFRCPNSSSTSSSADSIIRDAFLSDALVYGRMTCPGSTDTYATLTRVSSIESSPTVEWSTTIGRETANCDPSGPACSSTYAKFFFFQADNESHNFGTPRVLVTSPSQELVYFDVTEATDHAPAPVGTEVNQGDIIVTPSLNKGTELAYPNLIAPARRTSTGQMGLARIAIDRVFANGIDTIP